MSLAAWVGAPALALLLLASMPAAATPLEMIEVAPNLFVHPGRQEDFTPSNLGGIADIGFVIGQRSVAVIDTGGSRAEGLALLEAIRARTQLPISHLINTHVHPDHLLGNIAFEGTGAAVVGHVKLAQRLAEAGPFYLANLRRLIGAGFAGTELVPPTQPVAEIVTIDLGDRPLELRAWPTGHTNTDLTVLDTSTGTLFAGDLVFMERLPVVDGSLLGWLAIMDELERLPAQRVVSGHGPASAPWPEALAAERTYLEFLRDQVRAALGRNRTLAQAVYEVPLPPGQHWQLAAEITHAT